MSGFEPKIMLLLPVKNCCGCEVRGISNKCFSIGYKPSNHQQKNRKLADFYGIKEAWKMNRTNFKQVLLDHD